MNTIEKRKIETILTEDISREISSYRSRRSEEYNVKREAYEKNPPKAVLGHLARLEAAESAQKEAERSIEKAGWRVSRSYRNEKTTVEPTASSCAPLMEHQKETEAGVAQLQSLSRKYTLRIYAGGAEMEELLAGLADDIATVTKRTN